MATPARIIKGSTENLFADHRDSCDATQISVSGKPGTKRFSGSGSLEMELLLQQIEAREAVRRGPDKMNLLDGTDRCNLESCVEGARITLGGARFCLDHFILGCYDRLDQLDPRIRNRRGEIKELNSLREPIEECSNRALLVSLRCEFLTNLDRSRLLDILLWSSDLLFLLNISARDFDLLSAFRQDSELATSSESSPSRPLKTQTRGESAQNS